MTPGVIRGLQSVCENAGEGRAGLSPGCFLFLVAAPGDHVPSDPRYVSASRTGHRAFGKKGGLSDLARSFPKMTDGGQPRGPVTACRPFLMVRGGVAPECRVPFLPPWTGP